VTGDSEKETPSGGDVYGAYIKSHFDFQQTRKTNLESKAAAIITTSGTLVTLLFGLVAVVTGASGFVLPGATHGWLIAAIMSFVVAAALAIVGSVIPVPYGELIFQPDKLAGAWNQPAKVASQNVARLQIQQSSLASRRNGVKAWLVLLGGAAELVALAMLAVAVVTVLATASPTAPTTATTTTSVAATTSSSRG
jgi:hypothetical protein